MKSIIHFLLVIPIQWRRMGGGSAVNQNSSIYSVIPAAFFCSSIFHQLFPCFLLFFFFFLVHSLLAGKNFFFDHLPTTRWWHLHPQPVEHICAGPPVAAAASDVADTRQKRRKRKPFDLLPPLLLLLLLSFLASSLFFFLLLFSSLLQGCALQVKQTGSTFFQLFLPLALTTFSPSFSNYNRLIFSCVCLASHRHFLPFPFHGKHTQKKKTRVCEKDNGFRSSRYYFNGRPPPKTRKFPKNDFSPVDGSIQSNQRILMILKIDQNQN